MTTTPEIGSPPVSPRVPLTPPGPLVAPVCGRGSAAVPPQRIACPGRPTVPAWARDWLRVGPAGAGGGDWAGRGTREGGDGHFPLHFGQVAANSKILRVCLSTLLFFCCPHRLFSTEQSRRGPNRDSWFNPRKVFCLPPGLMCLNIPRGMTRRRGRKREGESLSGRGESGNRKRECNVYTCDTKRGTEKKK